MSERSADPDEVGVGREVVDAVEHEHLFGFLVPDDLRDALLVVAHVDEYHLAVILREERRKAVAEAVLDHHDRAAVGAAVLDGRQRVVAVEEHGIFVVLVEVAVEVERVVFLALGALGDGDLDVAAVAGIAPDLNVVGLGEPEACGRVGRAVEVRVDLRVELVAVDGRLVEVLAERGVCLIRAYSALCLLPPEAHDQCMIANMISA